MGKNPQQIKNINPTGKDSAVIALAPVKTSIWRGIRIANAANPAIRRSELNRARNALIGQPIILVVIQSICSGLPAAVKSPALCVPRKVPSRREAISRSNIILNTMRIPVPRKNKISAII